MARFFSTVSQARGALAQDCGFDPFVSGGWGRCTEAKLAASGYVVDAAAAAQEEQDEAAADEAIRNAERERVRRQAEYDALPHVRKYRAAAKLLGSGNLAMVEIGDHLAHVCSDDGRACVVEAVDGEWVARWPHEGERIYAF